MTEDRMALLDQAVLGWRPWALLVALCLCLYLPGLAALPPLDRDEARFMQATRQMLETGDFVRIRFQDEARNKKPAGIHWLQAASVALSSTADSTQRWPYRVPSVIGATAAVLLTFGCGAHLAGRRTALLGASLLASCVLLVAEAHLAKTDAVLLATVAAAQGALGILYRRARDGTKASPLVALVFWLAQAAGILVKGPATPLVSLLTLLALSLADREWRWLAALRPGWGLPLAALLVAPWVVAIESATQGAFLGEAVGHDLLGKVAGAQESHSGFPGLYLLFAPATFWPASLLLALAGIAGWRRRDEPAVRFLIAWLVPSWLLFELVPTKLPHYVLPLYPALALLAGKALTGAVEGAAGKRLVWLEGLAFVLWVIVGLALSVALVVLPIMLGGGIAALSIVPAAAIISCGVILLRQAGRGFWPGSVLAMVAMALLVLVPAFASLLPGLDGLWLSRSAAAIVARHPPPAGEALITVGYNEPSLVFLLGGKTRSLDAAAAAAALAERPSARALVAGHDEEMLRQALGVRNMAAVKLDQASGINYSHSIRRITLSLYTAAPK
jgi:4-amino-4-deoxy-L-arabinose transferase-like glycosyltransferase